MSQILGEVPKTPKQLKEEQDASVADSLRKIRTKLVVMSGKGGVGKTSTSVNLSLALASRGFKVGLMDVDLHGPDVPRMLGLTGMPDVNANRKLEPMRHSANLVAISMESFLPKSDDAVIWRGPLKFSAIRQFIADVEWGNLDFLVIDSPPGTGDEPLTVAQQIPDARAIIVTTPQEVALADVRKSINFCRTVKLSILGMVENMSGLTCPHCAEVIEIFGSGGGERTAAEMGIDFLGRIPMDPRLVACGDSGRSFQSAYPDAPAARAYGEIAEKVARLNGRPE
jgi:ATP-binding protein involved in chromosome partitioning